MQQLTRASEFKGESSKHAASRWNFVDLIPLSLLLIATCLAIYFAGPKGNFPITDDFLYGSAVRSIVETGVFHIKGSNAFDFIPIQVGVLLCSFTGFSFEWLRLCTIIFHLFGITGLYLTLREMGVQRTDSAILSSLYALNPLLINLSLSFMTDVPALAFANWLLFFAVAGLKRRHLAYWVASILMLTAAMSVRQTALVFLPVVLLAGLFHLPKKSDKLLFLSAFIIPICSYLSLQKWLFDGTAINSCYSQYTENILSNTASFFLAPAKVLRCEAEAFCYLGFFTFPISLPLFVLAWKSARKISLVALVLTILFVTAPLIYIILSKHPITAHQLMPYSRNLFVPPYLGSYCAAGVDMMWRTDVLLWFTIVADFFASVTAFCLVLTFALQLLPRLFNQTAKPFNYRLFITFVFLLPFVALLAQLHAFNFDRYYTVIISPLVLCFAELWMLLRPQKFRLFSIGACLLLCFYGVAATLDCMNFNRAQWQAIRLLELNKILPERMDGGSEYTLEHMPAKLSQQCDMKKHGWSDELRGGSDHAKYRWWPAPCEDYVVSTGPMERMHEIGLISYWSPIRWKQKAVLLLQANNLNQKLSLPSEVAKK